MSPYVFLLLNLVLSFYLVGTIWAHEVDIFRSWKLIDPKDFHTVQGVHWHKLPYWILTPLGVALAGSIALIWFHPEASPNWAIWGNLFCQLAAHLLTALYWGRWQAMLANDDRGPASPCLVKILATHWVRTLLINPYGLILLVVDTCLVSACGGIEQIPRKRRPASVLKGADWVRIRVSDGIWAHRGRIEQGWNIL